MNLLSVVAVVTYVMQESHQHARGSGEKERSVVLWYINLVMFCIFVTELFVRVLVHPSLRRLLHDCA